MPRIRRIELVYLIVLALLVWWSAVALVELRGGH